MIFFILFDKKFTGGLYYCVNLLSVVYRLHSYCSSKVLFLVFNLSIKNLRVRNFEVIGRLYTFNLFLSRINERIDVNYVQNKL